MTESLKCTSWSIVETDAAEHERNYMGSKANTYVFSVKTNNELVVWTLVQLQHKIITYWTFALVVAQNKNGI